MSKRKNHVPAFKAQVALAALSDEQTITELSSEFGVHQTLIHKWVTQIKEPASGIFSGRIKTEEAKREKQLHELHAKIGQHVYRNGSGAHVLAGARYSSWNGTPCSPRRPQI